MSQSEISDDHVSDVVWDGELFDQPVTVQLRSLNQCYIFFYINFRIYEPDPHRMEGSSESVVTSREPLI